ncbi:MAG: hypothetical protein JWO46_766 [Nocardioidaceae bacterium]|nr:hypothetical protein [Nocardioidaceae bacterium]
MAMNEEPLERATRLVREQRPAGWVEASERIRSRLRSVVVPAQVFAAYVDGGRGSQVSVTSRVLLPALRSRLDTPQRVADAIDLLPAPTGADGSRKRLDAVQVELVCRYGADLAAEGEQARHAVVDVVRELLGADPSFDPDRDVRVRVVDVVEGDPRLA